MFSSTKIMTGHKIKWNLMGQKIYGDSGQDYMGEYLIVSGDGNVVAVRIPGPVSGGRDVVPGAVRVRVYGWNGSAWTRRGPDFTGGQYVIFGKSLSLNHTGNRLAISSPGYGAWTTDNQGRNTQAPASGNISVHNWNGTSWSQVANLTTPAVDYSSENSQHCELDDAGTTLAAVFRDPELPASNDPDRQHIPRAVIKIYQAPSWTEPVSTIFDNDSEISSGRFHFSKEANTLAYHLEGTGTMEIKTRNGNLWTRRTIPAITSPNRLRILGLSKDGDILAVAEGTDGKTIKVFVWSNGNWTRKGQDITVGGFGANGTDVFNATMSADGNSISIGMSGYGEEVGGTGKVVSLEFAETSWVQRQQINAEENSESCGRSISLSDDGKTLAVGSPLNDSLQPNTGEFLLQNKGLVRVFRHV
jgi:hypothetical protein